MITKLSLTENCYLSPALLAAAHQESYLLLHRPAPWGRIVLKVAGVIILVTVCLKWIIS